MTELITAIIDSRYNPSFTEADKIKNLAKNPAKGGMPAREKRNTSKAIALGLDVNLSPLRSDILMTSPSTVLKLRITAKIPNVVIRYIIK